MKLFRFLNHSLRQYLKIVSFCLVICCFNGNFCAFASSYKTGDWRAFGYGVMDSIKTKDAEQIDIYVDWGSATWGVGCMINVASDVDVETAKEIKVRVFTDNGSKTSANLEIETSDGTLLKCPASLVNRVDEQSKEFRFPLEEMIRSKSDSDSSDLKKTDGDYVFQIRILFAKPTDGSLLEEVIHVSKPEFIYPEYQAEKATSSDSEIQIHTPSSLLQKKAPLRDETPSQQSLPADTKISEEKQNSADTVLPVFSGNIDMYAPFVVGAGVKKWGTVEQNDQIFVAVKWSQSTEGVSIRFKLPPKSDELLRTLKFDIRTAYDSRSDIRLRVVAESGKTRTIYQDSKWRPKVTSNWCEYTFDFSGYFEEVNLFENDQPTHEFIEIMVRKPLPGISTVRDNEIILIRNPRLVKFEPTVERIEDTVEKKKPNLLNKIFGVLKPLGKSVSIYGDYVFDYSYNVSGGIATGSARRSFYDIGMMVDLKSALNWENGTAKIEFQKYKGDDASDLIGDFQGTGSNDTDDVEILAELWVERFFLEDTLRIKVGKIDSNTEFAFVDNGVEFTNASLSFASPTIFVLTTSPETAVGANLFLYPYENVYSGFGIYDGATQSGRSTGISGLDSIFRSPGSLFFIGEIGGSWINKESQLQSRFGIGVWRHNANFERFDGGVENGAEGFYLVMDKSIWQRNTVSDDCRQSLFAFVQYGYTSGTISDVEQHLSLGLVLSNPLGFRAEDLSGFGLTSVDFTDEPEAGYDDSFELAFEYFYKLQYNLLLSIKTNFQYVMNPGGDSNLDDAFVPGLRVEASF